MKKRLLSAAVMIAVGLPCILMGGWPFKVLLTFIGVVMAIEITSIKEKNNYLLLVGNAITILVCVYHQFIDARLICIGLFIVILGAGNKRYTNVDRLYNDLLLILCGSALYFAVEFYEIHQYLLLYAAMASLVCDAGAYFVGRKLGKHKLAPVISPKKTIEGAIGGILISTVISYTFAYFMNFFGNTPLLMLLITVLLTVVSEIGDLFFSYIKRHYGIKDYGNLIPGHGGVLDRLDSVIFVIVLLGLFIVL